MYPDEGKGSLICRRSINELYVVEMEGEAGREKKTLVKEFAVVMVRLKPVQFWVTMPELIS
jgi:hypothetical protein